MYTDAADASRADRWPRHGRSSSCWRRAARLAAATQMNAHLRRDGVPDGDARALVPPAPRERVRRDRHRGVQASGAPRSS